MHVIIAIFVLQENNSANAWYTYDDRNDVEHVDAKLFFSLLMYTCTRRVPNDT
jgi:hypothetical protein